MPDARQHLYIGNVRKGRNKTDPPLSLPDDQVVDAVNVDWFHATLARKRGGADLVTTTGGTFSGLISVLIRHVPGIDPTAAELWATDAVGNINRLAASTAFTVPTIVDPVTGHFQFIRGVSLNGKLFLAYESAQDRLHVWDPVLNKIRRTGLKAPVLAPAVANTGVGTYLATARYYKVAFTEQRATITVRRSELSPATAVFTPSGSGTGALVTQPTPVGEDETHWELYGSADGQIYGLISTTLIATTTYEDQADPNFYAGGTAPPLTGTNRLQKSYKFIAADGGRLIGFGAYTSTNKQSDLEFSAVIGDSDVGDDERVPLGYRMNLDENDSDVATGLAGPMNGAFYAFKEKQIWKITPTGSAVAPFDKIPVSKAVGAISQQSAVVGEDSDGRPALYFMSHKGPYRYGANGLEYLGGPVEDLLLENDLMNLAATGIVAHSVYHADKHQVWMYVCTGTNNEPNLKLMWDVQHNGWATHDGRSSECRCSVMFSETIGATMSRDLKPYIGRSSGTVIWKADTDASDDAGTAFRSYVTTKPYALGGIGYFSDVDEAHLIAVVHSGAKIELAVIADFALKTTTCVTGIDPKAAESRGIFKFDDARHSGFHFYQFRVGDPRALSTCWTLDALVIHHHRAEVW